MLTTLTAKTSAAKLEDQKKLSNLSCVTKRVKGVIVCTSNPIVVENKSCGTTSISFAMALMAKDDLS